MELTRSGVLVFMIASSQLITATPHGYGGYGVKGGAAAKAQAGAVAGAFAGAGALPIELPHGGAGFSGSYSKSSSSSFASSSASSSSSSFSYSGSGVIEPGCTSGSCPNSGANGIHAPNGNLNEFNSNAGTNGAVAAGAVAGSQYAPKDTTATCSGNNCNQKETDCKGPNCNDFSSSGNKCESGQCGTNPDTGSSDTNELNSKCANGQCGASGTTANAHNTGFASGYNNLKTQDSYNNKCISGNCAAPGASGTTSPNYNPTSENLSGQYPDRGDVPSTYGSHDTPNKCTAGQCGGSGDVPAKYESNDGVNKCASGQCGPSPGKDDASQNYDSNKCSSGQCNVHSPGTDDIPVNFPTSSRPTSSYGSNNQYPSKSPKPVADNSPGCTSGNCETFQPSQPTSTHTYSTTNPYPKPGYSDQNKDTPICTTPNCNKETYNPHASASGSASVPVYNKPVPFLTTPKQQSSCTSPHCSPHGSRPTVSVEYPYGAIVPGAFPSSGSIPSTSGQYNFGSTSIPGAYPSSAPNPGTPGHYPSGSIGPGPFPNSPSNPNTGCTGTSCGNPHFSTSTSNSVPSSTKYSNPQHGLSSFSYSKCSTPNCVPQTTQPIRPNGIPNYNSQSIAHAPSSPGGSLTIPQGYNPGINNKPLPTGLGTPTQPTSVNGISSTNPHGSVPSGTNYSPSLPTASSGSSSKAPNEDDAIPSFVALSPPKYPNCVGNSCSGSTSLPSYGQNAIPAYLNPANLGQPTGTKPNYAQGSIPTYPASSNSGQPAPPSSATFPHSPHGPASSNAGAHANKDDKPYLGGFGGPSGLLKPNEFNAPNNNIPASNNNPSTGGHPTTPCSSGICNPQTSSPHQGNSGSSIAIGSQVGGHNTAPCTTGNCGSPNGQTGSHNLNGAHAAAGGVAEASAVAYAGGFGGPPGLLVPFDHSKLGNGASGLSGKHSGELPAVGTQGGGHSTYHNGAGNRVQTGAGAQAIASAGAISGTPYGHGGTGGSGGNGGCSGGCGGSGSYGAGRSLDLGHSKDGFDGLYGGLGGAGAIAKAGAASYGSSFASAHASAGAAVKGGHYG